MDEYLDVWADFSEKLWEMDENKEYHLTMKEMMLLVRDFQADCYDGFVSNDQSYIEHWIIRNGIEEI